MTFLQLLKSSVIFKTNAYKKLSHEDRYQVADVNTTIVYIRYLFFQHETQLLHVEL